ncbi:MAG: imidazole glycerol phosphate synthase subunit HisH [Thermodesulfobacteriota bacterium]
MSANQPARAAIVDYALGNLFSVAHACRQVGLEPAITSDRAAIAAADIVFLPGVGAFGDAMANLRRLDLIGPLKDLAAAGRPLVGICLGMQLMLGQSQEFGRHRGLELVAGEVVRFDHPAGPRGPLKVPQVGWNRVQRPPAAGGGDPWAGTPLEGAAEGQYMYFVHSYYAKPSDPGVVLAVSRYGDVDFCSALRRGNLYAFQFHPERSAAAGLAVYARLAGLARLARGDREG